MEKIVESLIEKVNNSNQVTDEIKKIFEKAIKNTFTTTMGPTDRGDVFVITGDIEAMWLRDSAGQIRPLFYIDSDEANDLIKKVIQRQFFSVDKDYYANAFNKEANGRAWTHDDITDFESDWVWERKYELDSLAYIMQTAHLYYEKTKDSSIFDDEFMRILSNVVDQIELEQNHENSPYEFVRPNPEAVTETLRTGKKGSPVAYTGMSWSGFRPSDDSCMYQYLVPANAFTVVSLRRLAACLVDAGKDNDLAKKMKKLADEIDKGIDEYGKITDDEFGEILTYEVDGLGNSNFMDDANVPSLLSLAYLDYMDKDDDLYKNTRKAILSNKNHLYYEGGAAKGIGSDHTPKDYIWHIALAMQMMTSTEKSEQEEILHYFETTHDNKYLMHEGFHKDDPSQYTRDWFSWSNSMFCEAVLRYIGLEMIKA